MTPCRNSRAFSSSSRDEEAPLEDAIKLFEEGVKLTRAAQTLLAEAEQKVQLLLEEDGEPLVEPLDEE